MKQRIITGIALIAICLPPLIIGGIPLKCLMAVVAIGACYELAVLKKHQFDLKLFLGAFLFVVSMASVSVLSTSFLMIVLMIYLLVLAIVDENYSLDEIALFYLFSLILGFSINSILMIYEINNLLMIYVALATFGCDVGAYFFGFFFGKHKLNPRVSPKKTVEGAVGGWFVGMSLSILFACFFIEGLNDVGLIVLSIILPIVSQIGDLSFSLLKRHYQAKDFGSLFPGHGGMLDRVDSLLFCLIVVYGFIGVII